MPIHHWSADVVRFAIVSTGGLFGSEAIAGCFGGEIFDPAVRKVCVEIREGWEGGGVVSGGGGG